MIRHGFDEVVGVDVDKTLKTAVEGIAKVGDDLKRLNLNEIHEDYFDIVQEKAWKGEEAAIRKIGHEEKELLIMSYIRQQKRSLTKQRSTTRS